MTLDEITKLMAQPGVIVEYIPTFHERATNALERIANALEKIEYNMRYGGL